jgi:hypothetical protein
MLQNSKYDNLSIHFAAYVGNAAFRLDRGKCGVRSVTQCAISASGQHPTSPRRCTILAAGFPKQANPTQTQIEILAHGELLEYRDASKLPPQLDFFAVLGGMVRVREPKYISRFVSSKCTEHEISALHADLPKVLETGTQLEVTSELVPLPPGECPATRPIKVRCEATRVIEAKALHPAIPGRGIYLICKANNRIADGMTLYKIYLEDLGLALNLVESEYREGRKRQITKFEIEW